MLENERRKRSRKSIDRRDVLSEIFRHVIDGEHLLATRPRIVRALAIHTGRATGVTHYLMRSGPHAPWRAARVQPSGRRAGPHAPRSAPSAPWRIAPIRHVHPACREQQ